jgi:hypothetical protein
MITALIDVSEHPNEDLPWPSDHNTTAQIGLGKR